MAGGLHRAGLVDIDVSGIRPKCSLMGPQGRVDHGEVGLGASHQEMDGDVLPAAFRPDFRRGGGAVFVLPIAQGLHQIGLGKPGQHLFVAALAVVIVEVDHVIHSSFVSSILAPFPQTVKAHTSSGKGICCSSTQHRRLRHDRAN